MSPTDNLTFTSVQFDGQDLVANESGTYRCDHDGELLINYEIAFGNGDIYRGSYAEDIALLSFEPTAETEIVQDTGTAIDLYVRFKGTDSDKIIVKNIDDSKLKWIDDEYYPFYNFKRPAGTVTLNIAGTDFTIEQILAILNIETTTT